MGLLRRQMQSSGLCRIDNCNNSERSSRRFIKTNEAPYQTVGRRTFAATLGHRELTSGYFWLSVLSESISCSLYVFIVCATRISWTGSIIGHEPNLLAMAATSGAAMMLLLLIFRTVHVNPALTVAFLLTGRIPLIRALVYILIHCISSVAAIALLYAISVAGHAGALGLDNPHPLLESWQILVVEFVISFMVTAATYATCSYSSYTNARQFILEQVGLDCSDILDLKSTTCDTENIASIHDATFGNQYKHQTNAGGLLINSATMQQQQRPVTAALSSSLATAPRRPISSSNFRVHPQSKGYISDTYENSDFEYDYDNHRIYTQQQSSPEVSPGISRVPPIEELMHEESQLLAPNGFPLMMTPAQSFIIGMAYALTSLTGIPASGASLNPARSFGPAFFMNRWDNHWIFWVGPILGAVTAGFLYEFIFNPTRPSSMCYLPKLFRLSAHDMAKVGSKTKIYQGAQKPTIPVPDTINIFPSTMSTRAQPNHHFPIIQHSPTAPRHQAANNLMSNATLMNPSLRDPKHQQLIAPSTSLAHLQPNHLVGNNFDQLSYIQAQQQRQQHNNQIAHDVANFDHRSKSTAAMNFIPSKHQQNTINMPSRNNFHNISSSNGSTSQDFGADCAPADALPLYDNPTGRERFVAANQASQQISGPMRAPSRSGPAGSPGAGRQATLAAMLQRAPPARARPASELVRSDFLADSLARKRPPVAAATPSGRPPHHLQVVAGGAAEPGPRPLGRAHMDGPDDTFYQLPAGELEDSLRACPARPPGGSTGEASQSDSSGATNETISARAAAELVVSAEMLAGRGDYYA